MKLKSVSKVLVVGLLALTVQAQEVKDEEIIERIKPIGSVHVAGAQAASNTSGEPRSGEEIYNKYCVACHATGLLNAPKLNDAASWNPKLEKGFDAVLKNAINGINAMPPKGTCMDCSDEEIKASIEYMIKDI